MKTTHQFLIGLATLLSSVQLQWGQPVLGQELGAVNGSYTITDRWPHSRTWSRVASETNRQGQIISVTNLAYVEMATGLNFKDPATGQWTESQARFEITPEGYALARHGQHQVMLAPNINATNAVDLQMPEEGQRLTSRPLGLSFRDAASGATVLIAELKDCAGEWLAPNVVVYPDAFEGLHAALRYTYTRAGFEQDVVLYENPGSPAAYGMSPATTRLETWTEIFTAPTPRVSVLASSDGDEDHRVEFGSMALGPGRAYFLNLTNQDTPSLPVKKSWQQIGGRTFLVEAVRYAAAQPLLQQLAAVSPAQDSLLAHRVVMGREALLAQFTRQPTAKPTLVASITPGQMSTQPGLVLDYSILSSSNNFTFQGDTTYFVSGTVNLSGTTTIEGGTVVKFTNSTSAYISLNNTIVCRTDPYRPAVFTAMDDNTVGETISGSTGTPANYYARGLVVNSTGSTLHDLRFSYANKGIVLGFESGQISLANLQCVNCLYPIYSGHDFNTIIVDNSLFYSGSYVVFGGGGSDLVIIGRHLTVHGYDKVGPHTSDLTLTNSLVVGAPWGSGSVTTDSTVHYTTDPGGIFQTVGAASHYLAESSTNRDAGTTDIPASLLADLNKKTTYPPYEITTNFTGDTVLSPRGLCDKNSCGANTPDLGYHYDLLDYVVSGRTVSANLTLNNGVALGTYGTSSSYGLGLSSGSFVSAGFQAHLNWIARYNTVQEQSTTSWSASTVAAGVKMLSGAPLVNIRFTGWSLLGGTGDHFYDATDGTTPTAFIHSQFGGGKFTIAPGSVALTNCVLERVSVKLQDDDEYGREWDLFNNLFYGGTLFYRARGDDPTLRAYDNLFDQTAITRAGGSASFDHDYNGYITGQNRLISNAEHDVILNNPPVYLTGHWGSYYYPAADGNLSRLIDAGSATSVSVGLDLYTTQVDQFPDSGLVDIGYHYASITALITGNNAGTPSAHGPIQTYDFATGNLVNSFVPQSAGNGRGLAIKGTEIFFTEVDSEPIHVCYYGATGSGVLDIRTLDNPRPGKGIQDLAFHNGDLYVLTGYLDEDQHQLQVFKLDPTTGDPIGDPITIQGPANVLPDTLRRADGFTVLPSGNFLINEGDMSPFYNEYDGTTGAYIAGGLRIDLTNYDFQNGTGVATAPDGQSLYFYAAHYNPDFHTFIQTDLCGNLISQSIESISSDFIEDIDVVAP